MNKIGVIIFLAVALFACREQELPEAEVLDKAALSGTWTTTGREVVLSQAKINEKGITYYVDSLITEKIDITFELAGANAAKLTVVKYDENNQPSTPSVVNASWQAGQTTGGEYLDAQKYIIVFDPTKPHQQKTDEWLNTYTIESVSANQMTLVWTLHNSTARNAKRFTAEFTK